MEKEETKTQILIVDDQPENLLLLSKILERPELEIVKARSGKDALEASEGMDLAAAILDVQMPEMNGFELAAELLARESSKGVPILFLTALSAHDRFILKGYESGAVDYLFKPIEPHIIRSKVAVFLKLHRRRKLIEEQSKALASKVAELSELNKNLQLALEQIKTLKGIIPICAHCKKVRFDKGYWEQVEKFIERNSEADISHGICPDCLRKYYPDMADEVLGKAEEAGKTEADGREEGERRCHSSNA